VKNINAGTSPLNSIVFEIKGILEKYTTIEVSANIVL
jgi:hypothetical protein